MEIPKQLAFLQLFLLKAVHGALVKKVVAKVNRSEPLHIRIKLNGNDLLGQLRFQWKFPRNLSAMNDPVPNQII